MLLTISYGLLLKECMVVINNLITLQINYNYVDYIVDSNLTLL